MRRATAAQRGVAALIAGLLALAPACRRPQARKWTRILCLGDSNTTGYYTPLKRLLREQALPALLLIPGDKYGFNSRAFVEALDREPILADARPDVVLLMVGTNDARIDSRHCETEPFTANLEEVIDRIAASKTRPRILLASVPPIFHSDQANFDAGSLRRIGAEINPAIRTVARRRGLVLVDVEAALAGRRELIPGVHAGPAGYRLIAETFLAALLPLLRVEAR